MKQVKIDIPEGYEVDTENSDLSKGEIKFRKIEKEYPTHISEVKGRLFYIDYNGAIIKTDQDKRGDDPNNVSTEERAKAILALTQLVELRDAYNRIDGNEADEDKRAIIRANRDGSVRRCFTIGDAILSFKKESTRDLFYENFEDLIEQAKEFLV